MRDDRRREAAMAGGRRRLRGQRAKEGAQGGEGGSARGRESESEGVRERESESERETER